MTISAPYAYHSWREAWPSIASRSAAPHTSLEPKWLQGKRQKQQTCMNDEKRSFGDWFMDVLAEPPDTTMLLLPTSAHARSGVACVARKQRAFCHTYFMHNVKRDPALKQRSLLTNCILIQARDDCLLGLDVGPLRSSRLGPLHPVHDAIDGQEPLPRRLRSGDEVAKFHGAGCRRATCP